MKKILNILLGVVLLVTVILTVYAIVAGGSNEAINLNLIWGYILLAGAVVTALFSAVWSMVNSSKGIKGTLLSTLLVVVIVLAAYLIARGHTIEIPDIANGGFFPHPETVITEASILVTYVALGAAVLTAIFTEIYKAFK
ncbi:hypothetical protein [Alistipes putredinis]|jgi:glucan phosphoethanolaminetransferase (alkaline phosphatase superfamily)|uniref:hypothetical protein n=1 Tax=Alistipes putredinis TaxID=28117 RepID=UPI003A8579AA